MTRPGANETFRVIAGNGGNLGAEPSFAEARPNDRIAVETTVQPVWRGRLV